MSIINIAAALESRLIAAAPPLDTAFENKTFDPTVGVPYRRVNLLVNKPRTLSLEADLTEHLGIFQVSLFWPLGAGRGDIQAQAQAVADAFQPVQYLTHGGTRVDIDETPRIHGGYRDGDRWCVPVSIYWRSFKT